MRGQRAVLGFSLILALAPSHPGGAAEEPTGPYVWPLKGYNDVSSGFCDYRTRHYHGGIDLSTNGAEGIPVRAADSGWVERVSTSYWGYGKAVYLKMTDGRMAVYGHLSEFSPAIQAYVEDNQYSSKRYQQNLWPPPHQLPIGRGEVIGKTGQTGAGPPHLHFEIRTGDNKPLNPLRFGFKKSDRLAPSIHSVTFLPRQPDEPGHPVSLVDGGMEARTFDVTGKGNSRTIAATPKISGICGIAVKTDDHFDAPRWTASTYRVRLWINEILVADLSHDSINYDDTRQIVIEHLYDARPGYAERPLALFRQPGNTLWHYTSLLNNGWIESGATATTGVNDCRIEAADAAGNTSTVRFKFTLVPVADATIPGGKSTEDPRVVSIEPLANGAVITLESTADRPVVSLDRAQQFPLATIPAGKNRLACWLPAKTAQDTIWLGPDEPYALGLHAVSAVEGAEIISTDGLAVARFGALDLYHSSFFELSHRDPVGGAVSSLYELSPEAVPLARAATFAIRHDGTADASRIALYRRRGPGRWDFVGNHLQPGPMIGGKIDWPGEFALLADHDPPVIRHVTPGRGESTRNKRPTIRFEMFDNLSGIGSDADVQMTIDGAWVPVEYDPDTRQAKARPRAALSKGKHEVEIKVRDRVGNEATFLRIITIVG